MPVWLELTILLLLTYAVGLGVGWALWGRDGGAGQAGGDLS